jgi:DNA-binding transcriptional ArsR family regulator
LFSFVEPTELAEELRALGKRIDELESMIRLIIQPLQQVGKTTSNYLRLIGLLLEHGGLTPDTLLPEIHDPIERTIVQVLTKKPEQNISQITEMVRNTRGKASRRIIRKKLEILVDKNIVVLQQTSSRPVYRLTDEVIKKWSQVLGLSK